MNRSLKVFTICFLIHQAAILGSATDDDDIENRSNTLTEGVGKLSIEILRKIAVPGENTLFSAYGISSALALCFFGADGKTYAALKDVLGLESVEDAEIPIAFRDASRTVSSASSVGSETNASLTLSSAYALFANDSLRMRPEYLKTVRQVFTDVSVESVDFAGEPNDVQRKINSFVEEATRGKITDLLNQPLDSQTLLAVINAVYFKGSWKTALKIKQSDQSFNNFTCPTLRIKPSSKVQWMTLNSKVRYGRSSSLRGHFLELPYHSGVGTTASMILVLPYEDSRCNFSEWVHNLDWSKITEVLSELSETRVELSLPKFKLKGVYDMKRTLSSIGLDVVFSRGASFSNMLSEKDRAVPISNFLHKAKMSVDELGTEAAAASGAFLRRRSRPLPSVPPIELVFNRSFLAMIEISQSGSRLPLFTAIVHEV